MVNALNNKNKKLYFINVSYFLDVVITIISVNALKNRILQF